MAAVYESLYVMTGLGRANAEVSRFDDILFHPDVYHSWLRYGDTPVPDYGRAELVGGVCVQLLSAGTTGDHNLYTGMFIAGGGEELERNQTAFQEGYNDFFTSFANPLMANLNTFYARYDADIIRKTKLSLARRRLSVAGAYLLLKSENGELSSCFDVSAELIRQAQVAASESGLIQRDQRTANSLKGRLLRHKAREPDTYGEILGKALVCKLLLSPSQVEVNLDNAATEARQGRRLKPLRSDQRLAPRGRGRRAR